MINIHHQADSLLIGYRVLNREAEVWHFSELSTLSSTIRYPRNLNMLLSVLWVPLTLRAMPFTRTKYLRLDIRALRTNPSAWVICLFQSKNHHLQCWSYCWKKKIHFYVQRLTKSVSEKVRLISHLPSRCVRISKVLYLVDIRLSASAAWFYNSNVLGWFLFQVKRGQKLHLLLRDDPFFPCTFLEMNCASPDDILCKPILCISTV